MSSDSALQIITRFLCSQFIFNKYDNRFESASRESCLSSSTKTNIGFASLKWTQKLTKSQRQSCLELWCHSEWDNTCTSKMITSVESPFVWAQCLFYRTYSSLWSDSYQAKQYAFRFALRLDSRQLNSHWFLHSNKIQFFLSNQHSILIKLKRFTFNIP